MTRPGWLRQLRTVFGLTRPTFRVFNPGISRVDVTLTVLATTKASERPLDLAYFCRYYCRRM